MKQNERTQIKNLLRAYLEQTLDSRVDRFLEFNHRWIIGKHPFSRACFEAIELFRDGYFTGSALLSRSVAESLLRFVAERNLLNPEGSPTLSQQLGKLGLLSAQGLQAVEDIRLGLQADFHFRPTNPSHDMETVARNALLNLSALESEIFGCHMLHGRVTPKSPRYWNLEDGEGPLCVHPEDFTSGNRE